MAVEYHRDLRCDKVGSRSLTLIPKFGGGLFEYIELNDLFFRAVSKLGVYKVFPFIFELRMELPIISEFNGSGGGGTSGGGSGCSSSEESESKSRNPKSRRLLLQSE